ncbi:U-box domain-containing protein 5-like [Impatiens glandulifera]|uniref:U-box domain-containing protein 5-like n=1 Tax=Impatiens glandulifera TaxID=253017 RepID=UPI001FB0AA40|nr:U-box domain-containing protein 5-like [Impatiens glandulifera]XP_047324830.1 U-box domain-containing protein 5-like [Impatiens glandulifera]
MDFQYPWTIKVHHFMCLKLKKFIDDTSNIFANMESALPKCKSGIEALCSLQSLIERAKLLILYCSESSKLYLAVMGNKIMLRCERLRDSLLSSLSQMQHMYPCSLARQIERIVQDLSVSTFIVESSEDEAGKVLLSLMKRDVVASSSFNMLEFQSVQMAAIRLQLTSPVEVLIEKRSIRKLLEKIKDSDLPKRKILKYLLYLMRKYGKLIGRFQTINEGRELGNPEMDQVLCVDEPHKEFKCPISGKLMYDPVQTTNGQTFERMLIEKWFANGNETCPKTSVKLSDFSLVPDLAIKDAISVWCEKHGITISKPCIQPNFQELSRQGSSVGSHFSTLDGLGLDVSNVSIHSSDADSGCDLLDIDPDDGRSNVEFPRRNINIDHVFDLGFLSILGTFPWVLQCKEVEDLNVKVKDGHRNISSISVIHIVHLVRFLDDAHDLPDVKAEKDGISLLLALLKATGNEMVQLPEDAIYVLSSMLANEITEEALAVMEIVSSQKYSEHAIVASGVLLVLLGALEDHRPECKLLALKTMSHLSENSAISHHMVYLDYIARVSLLLDDDHDYYSIKILRNLCNIEEAIAMIAESDDCNAAITHLLDVGTKEQQELAMDLLRSLCYDSTERCQQVLRDSIIRSLTNVFLDGDHHTLKLAARDLLQLSWN